MFVRWRKRQSKRKGATLVAELCENRRVNDQPRLAFIATLGSIAADAVEQQFLDEQAAFWKKVDVRLDRLVNRLTADERAAVVDALEQKVLRKTEQEATDQRFYLAWNRNDDKWVMHNWQRFSVRRLTDIYKRQEESRAWVANLADQRDTPTTPVPQLSFSPAMLGGVAAACKLLTMKSENISAASIASLVPGLTVERAEEVLGELRKGGHISEAT